MQDFLQLIVNGKEDGLFSKKHIVSNENDYCIIAEFN